MKEQYLWVKYLNQHEEKRLSKMDLTNDYWNNRKLNDWAELKKARDYILTKKPDKVSIIQYLRNRIEELKSADKSAESYEARTISDLLKKIESGKTHKNAFSYYKLNFGPSKPRKPRSDFHKNSAGFASLREDINRERTRTDANGNANLSVELL